MEERRCILGLSGRRKEVRRRADRGGLVVKAWVSCSLDRKDLVHSVLGL